MTSGECLQKPRNRFGRPRADHVLELEGLRMFVQVCGTVVFTINFNCTTNYNNVTVINDSWLVKLNFVNLRTRVTTFLLNNLNWLHFLHCFEKDSHYKSAFYNVPTHSFSWMRLCDLQEWSKLFGFLKPLLVTKVVEGKFHYSFTSVAIFHISGNLVLHRVLRVVSVVCKPFIMGLTIIVEATKANFLN